MNERSFIVKSYSAIYLLSSRDFGRIPSSILVTNSSQLVQTTPWCLHVVAASDRGDPRLKHVAAVNFKISYLYLILSPRNDATQPA
jgi:hypothetical protein